MSPRPDDTAATAAAAERRIAHVLRLLEGGHRTYQRAAVDEALEIGPAIEPPLIAILDKVLAEPEAFVAYGNEDYAGHLYALALLAHLGSAEAHPRVLRLARLPEALSEKLLGDAVTELVPLVLYRTSGGSLDALHELCTDPQVALGSRDAALGALAYLALDDEAARARVLELFASLLSEPDRSIADMDFVSLVANRALDLYPATIMPTIEQAFRKGRIDPFAIALADFERVMAEPEQDVLAASRETLRGLTADVHGYVTRWASLEQTRPGEDPARDAKARQRALDKKRKQGRKRTRKARKHRR
ncbi:MAG: DUF1186 domain-containing protein [Deltaproteobacteria bacterium]|jgi:hypothetical protein|nr:DUF1186 domain-containing protein [Deltaproteobacteria bacterium]MBW2530879.1 DUF1186 domain-containing protein [Deltaproteobacteria bacterium]